MASGLRLFAYFNFLCATPRVLSTRGWNTSTDASPRLHARTYTHAWLLVCTFREVYLAVVYTRERTLSLTVWGPKFAQVCAEKMSMSGANIARWMLLHRDTAIRGGTVIMQARGSSSLRYWLRECFGAKWRNMQGLWDSCSILMEPVFGAGSRQRFRGTREVLETDWDLGLYK